MRGAIALVAVVAVVALAMQAVAGPDWVEGQGAGPGGGDAGPLPDADQETQGLGIIGSISGRLEGFNIGANECGEGEADFEDMYRVLVVDPSVFSATMVAGTGGFADFDAKLTLLFESGLGLISNDDADNDVGGALFECPLDLDINGFTDMMDLMTLLSEWGPNPGSAADADGDGIVGILDLLIMLTTWGECPAAGPEMGNMADDETGAALIKPGIYRIAVSPTEREPVSQPGPIFFFADPTEISGPDGVGGEEVITEWQDVDNGNETQGMAFEDGDYRIILTGCEFAAPPQIENVAIDIKPGSCPNPYNPDSHGVQPTAIVGTCTFDASFIDPASIRIARADGVGGSVAPNMGPPGPSPTLEDVTSPFDGEPCDCGAPDNDGILDLMVHFNSDEMTDVLELGELENGTSVELVISGEFLDGTAFSGSDCIVIVPPAEPPGMVDLSIDLVGAFIYASPPDSNVDTGGYSHFQRGYLKGTVVTLTAPASQLGATFIGWYIDGSPVLVTDETISLEITGDVHTVEVVYQGPDPTPP